jgi:hypothetical protein
VKSKRKPAELFLSHASADRRFVSKLALLLRKHGIHVWYSRHALVGADQWHDEIGKALRRCDWFLVILSPAAVKSMWVKREVLFALKQRRFRDRIIPLLYKPCAPDKVSWALDDAQMVDFQKGFDAGMTKLLAIWI